MRELDEILSEALFNSSRILEVVPKERIFSTCVEIPPGDEDTTPLPYIVITDDPFTPEGMTKDDEWMTNEERCQASVIISAESPNDVRRLRRLVRKSIADYVIGLGEAKPYLVSLTNEGISWDWSKPCYYDNLHYQCYVNYEEY